MFHVSCDFFAAAKEGVHYDVCLRGRDAASQEDRQMNVRVVRRSSSLFYSDGTGEKNWGDFPFRATGLRIDNPAVVQSMVRHTTRAEIYKGAVASCSATPSTGLGGFGMSGTFASRPPTAGVAVTGAGSRTGEHLAGRNTATLLGSPLAGSERRNNSTDEWLATLRQELTDMMELQMAKVQKWCDQIAKESTDTTNALLLRIEAMGKRFDKQQEQEQNHAATLQTTPHTMSKRLTEGTAEENAARSARLSEDIAKLATAVSKTSAQCDELSKKAADTNFRLGCLREAFDSSTREVRKLMATKTTPVQITAATAPAIAGWPAQRGTRVIVKDPLPQYRSRATLLRENGAHTSQSVRRNFNPRILSTYRPLFEGKDLYSVEKQIQEIFLRGQAPRAPPVADAYHALVQWILGALKNPELWADQHGIGQRLAMTLFYRSHRSEATITETEFLQKVCDQHHRVDTLQKVACQPSKAAVVRPRSATPATGTRTHRCHGGGERLQATKVRRMEARPRAEPSLQSWTPPNDTRSRHARSAQPCLMASQQPSGERVPTVRRITFPTVVNDCWSSWNRVGLMSPDLVPFQAQALKVAADMFEPSTWELRRYLEGSFTNFCLVSGVSIDLDAVPMFLNSRELPYSTRVLYDRTLTSMLTEEISFLDAYMAGLRKQVARERRGF